MLPSLYNLFQGPEEECCSFFIEKAFKQVFYRVSEINNGTIDFAPALASWIFILAVINVAFPRVFPRFIRFKWLEVLLRFLSPYIAFRFCWIPFNRLLFYFFEKVLELSQEQTYQVRLKCHFAFLYTSQDLLDY